MYCETCEDILSNEICAVPNMNIDYINKDVFQDECLNSYNKKGKVTHSVLSLKEDLEYLGKHKLISGYEYKRDMEFINDQLKGHFNLPED
jgi:hypothetical protein